VAGLSVDVVIPIATMTTITNGATTAATDGMTTTAARAVHSIHGNVVVVVVVVVAAAAAAGANMDVAGMIETVVG